MEMKKKENGGVKIAVSVDAEKALEEMVVQVNDGFSGGRVTKQDLASWLVKYFAREAFSRCVENLRADHFDQVAHLEAVLRKAKEARRSGAANAEVDSILGSAFAQSASLRQVRRRKAERQGISDPGESKDFSLFES